MPTDPPFDPARTKADFEKQFSVRLNMFKENLPDDILQKVADIRVLALGISSQEIKQEITKYCKQNKGRVAAARKEYIKTRIEYQKQHKELLLIKILQACMTVMWCPAEKEETVLH